MPRTAIDYSKSLIYKICPIDKKIEECYIGSTTSFSRRKYDHKLSCNNIQNKAYSKPLYKHIRENGGWDAFEMVLIEYYPCGSSLELRQREEYWRSTFKAELNAKRCYSDGKCKIDDCENVVVNNGVCVKHGAVLRKCKIENCTNHSQNNGLCKKHGPKITCKCGSIISEHGFKAHLKSKKHIAHEKNYFQKEFNFIL